MGRDFQEIFGSTTSFLTKKGIEPFFDRGDAVSVADIRAFEKRTGLELPPDVARFYADYADGLLYSWDRGEDVGGFIQIASLEEIETEFESWRELIREFLDDSDALHACIDPPFREKARAIWRRMEAWLPFWNEGNGDHFCFDTVSGLIVYDQHDWFDGFGELAQDNGAVAGRTLPDFLDQWSRFCFCSNSSLWWGDLDRSGTIDWDARHFPTEFCRDL